MILLFLKKLVTSLLLPPGLFALIICAASMATWRRNRSVSIFCFCAGFLMWGLSIAPIADRLAALAEKGEQLSPRVSGDVIILLGGGITEYARDLTGMGIPGEDMMYRIVTAVRIQKRLHVPVLVSGGAFVEGRVPEAVVVKRFLSDLGVPETMILVEDRSRDTAENAGFCRKILMDRGYRRPILVTSGYHMRRAAAEFAIRGVDVTPLPAFLRVGATPVYTLFHYLPDPGALKTSSSAMREQLGLLFQRLPWSWSGSRRVTPEKSK